jgi:OmpA-OmpF porin, OOP family
MRLKPILLLTLSLLINVQAFSQHSSDHYKLAKAYYIKNDFYNAIGEYKVVVKKNPDHAEAWFELGNSYHFSRNHQSAVEAYGKLSRLIIKNKQQKNNFYMAYLRHGISLMAIEDYEEAKKVFLDLLRLRPKAENIKALKRTANNRIQSCKVAMKMHENTYANEFTISSMPEQINSGYSDFAPVWLDSSTLVFTSLNKDKLIEVDPSKSFPVNQKLYVSHHSNDKWQNPETFEQFSHEFFHTANGSFSSDGKKFVFSRCQENQEHEIRCALYISEYSNGHWGKPLKMKNNINLSGYTSTQPALGEYKKRGQKNQILYFVSDRNGGRGNQDIWYSILKGNGEWTEPINCGSAINTQGNEITPYYHGKTMELFFSSDFHYGLGGYDVFKAFGGLKSFKRPENLGIPVNSGFDDTYFSWRLYLENGTLVSNRTGSRSVFSENCCDDIYYFNYQSAYIIEGHVVAPDSTKSIMENVEIGLANLEHLEYPDSVNWITQTDDMGTYKLKYQQNAYVVVAKEGYETQYVKISDLIGANSVSVTNITMVKDIEWEKQLTSLTYDKVHVLSEKTLSNKVTKGSVFVMEHIHFDFNETDIKPEAYQDLILLKDFLSKNSKTMIEIGGHTDNLGSDEHNRELSQRRAEAIRVYLINKGINADRLLAIGYGEGNPIAENQNPDGSDNFEGRKLNRRTEIKILK